MSIKTNLFFFLTFCCINTPISGIIDYYCIMENQKKKKRKKNSVKKGTKKEQYTLKIMKMLRNASLGDNCTSSYKT